MSANLKQHLNFIAGELVSPKGNQFIDHENPSTGKLDSQLAASGLLDLVSALQSAHKGLLAWQKLEPNDRSSILMKAAELLEHRGSSIARRQALDQGTPISATLRWSIPTAVQAFKLASQWTLASPQSETGLAERSGDKVGDHNDRSHFAVGVVGIITPAFDPIVSLAIRLAPALAAGNSVIAKGSHFSPDSNLVLAEVLRDAGLPTGVFNLLQGRGDEVGAAMISHPGLTTISFSGSEQTGREILQINGDALKKIHLSLGAKNPVLVFAGVDLAKTAALVAKILAGVHPSPRLRGSRLFVQESIFKEFIAALKVKLEDIKIADPQLEETELGPLPKESLLEHFRLAVGLGTQEKGKKLMEEGISAVGSVPAEAVLGSFLKPQVLVDLTLCSTIQQDEILGPFASASSFKYQFDAIKQANTNPQGHAAFVFEEDAAKALKVASKLEFGRVFVNTEPFEDQNLVFTPLKNSGSGAEGFASYFKFFSRESRIIRN
jgi:acyl-CoA reductase-like NAD-dependent aldehyde dehydrogenase